MIVGMNEKKSGFAGLDPELVMDAVERHCGIRLDGSVTPYNSYVNRVFGLTDEDEKRYVAKFYRPERWTREAILDEHRFLADCAAAEIPVVTPVVGLSGETLGEAKGILFAVFPAIRARTFDIYGDDDWLRIGRTIGRLHAVGRARQASARLRCTPDETTARYVKALTDANLVHPDCAGDFTNVCDDALAIIRALFDGLSPRDFHRIHGDCHRGNILQNGDGAITLIDFDDMMTGPAIQDLWLLLPGHLDDSMREMNLILEGYEEFAPFNRSTLALVEPLRFMRQLYFLAWCATQRDDPGFADRNPGWGSRSFWITETEDLATQLGYLAATTERA
jgi:Ser/Thr protein kinase RdoA (MazF antagonist)